VIAALLAGVAIAVVLWRPSARLGPPAPAPARLPQVAAGAAGLALWLGVGGVTGLLLGAAVAALLPRLLGRLDAAEPEDAAVAAELPLALELLAACLAGGAPPGAAVTAVADAFPGPCGERLHRVAAGLALGVAPSVAWGSLGAGRDPAGSAARAMARAAEGGSPVAGAVQRAAADARRAHAADLRRRAARVGVWAVLPLGACFLPAFVLLGVVPAVVGLAGPILHRLG